MRQGDIVKVQHTKNNHSFIGIAYDSRVIIRGGLFTTKAVSYKMIELTQQYIVTIYRPTFVLNHHKRAYMKNILAGLVTNSIKIPIKERLSFKKFINRLYRHITKLTTDIITDTVKETQFLRKVETINGRSSNAF